MKEKDIKIILLGNNKKTDLFTPFITNKFKDDYKTTMGVDFMIKEIKTENYLTKMVIWDISSSPDFHAKLNLYLKDGDAVIIIEDNVTEINMWKEKIGKYSPRGIEIVVLSPQDSVEDVLEVLTLKFLKEIDKNKEI